MDIPTHFGIQLDKATSTSLDGMAIIPQMPQMFLRTIMKTGFLGWYNFYACVWMLKYASALFCAYGYF